MAQEEERVKIIFDTNAKQAASDTNKLGASIDNATNATNENNDAVSQGNAAYKTFKAQLREANQELQKQIQLTGESSTETIKAAKAVAELKDQMGFASDLADSFNPDQKMKALGAATRVAATGVQGITAGMALFGDQSEDTQKALLKVQAAMAFSDAISGLSDLGDQFALLKNIVQDSYTKIVAAKRADILVTTQATVAQRLLNLVANSNPYILLASAVAAVGIATYAWIKASKEADKELAKTTLSVNRNKIETDALKKSIDESAKSASESNSIEILRARAFGATDKEIQKLIKSQKELAVATSGTQAKEAYNNLLKARQSLSDAIKSEDKDLIETAKQTQSDAQSLYEASNESYNSAIIADVENTLNARIELNNKTKEANQKASDDAEQRNAKAKEKRDREREEEKKRREEDTAALNQFQIDSYNAELANKILQDEQQIERLNNITAQVEKIEEDSANRRIEIEQKMADQKATIQEGQLNLADAAVGFLSRIAGKNKTLQKAAIIAESALGIGKSVIATNASNVAATAEGAALAIPTGGASVAAAAGLVTTNYVALGLGVAGNIAATAKALQALGGGSAPSAGGVSGGGVRGSAPPAVAFNNTAENQIGQSVAKTQSDQPPLKVYVSESDISDAQNNVKVLVNKNVFP
jgi:hypothetical protein